MNIEQARDILDSAKAGLNVSTAKITEALCLTGDLCTNRHQAQPQVLEPAREWPYYAVARTAS